MMTDLEKERVLHKVLASSAFLLSLFILPLAQYFFGNPAISSSPVSSQVGGTESGRVAGVSTQKVLQADIPAPTPNSACLAQRHADLAGLQLFEDGEKAAYMRNYQNKTAAYQQALLVTTGTPEQIKADKDALNQSIAAEYQTYLKKLSALEATVASQKKEIESRSCLSL